MLDLGRPYRPNPAFSPFFIPAVGFLPGGCDFRRQRRSTRVTLQVPGTTSCLMRRHESINRRLQKPMTGGLCQARGCSTGQGKKRRSLLGHTTVQCKLNPKFSDPRPATLSRLVQQSCEAQEHGTGSFDGPQRISCLERGGGGPQE